MKGQMEHIETKMLRTDYFKFPEKFRNYRRVLVIMTITPQGVTKAGLKLDDGANFQLLSVQVNGSNWERQNLPQFNFLANPNEPSRLQFEITPYKYAEKVKTELKMLYDNDDPDTENSLCQVAHLTFDEHIDNIVLIPVTDGTELNISYRAYGELE